ncbi:hypothetical protein SAMN04244572_02263 [Azotobacter beijerinckii]|uniref:Uncharacterized protein n=1 Tax=Azotobacter beijerinckii TaxID=170623 RepID=A0A1H6UV67_9GAMM|nr:hypothetical protein [Azotobacter beijerinckii]SEI96259.1 hypothetical protein SAMN04244572_02263 [Azotobacter beijerinckii]
MNAYPHRLLAAVSLLLSLPLSAASLDAALEESQRLAEETKASQERIEALVCSTNTARPSGRPRPRQQQAPAYLRLPVKTLTREAKQ